MSDEMHKMAESLDKMEARAIMAEAKVSRVQRKLKLASVDGWVPVISIERSLGRA